MTPNGGEPERLYRSVDCKALETIAEQDPPVLGENFMDAYNQLKTLVEENTILKMATSCSKKWRNTEVAEVVDKVRKEGVEKRGKRAIVKKRG